MEDVQQTLFLFFHSQKSGPGSGSVSAFVLKTMDTDPHEMDADPKPCT